MKIIVYQITNICNQKKYVGVHKTNNLDDGYLGSGVLINRAIWKYGRENFVREILHECETTEEALEIEARIVNEEFISRSDVYNLTLGGGCGWHFVNHVLGLKSFEGRHHTNESKAKMSVSIKKAFADPDFKRRFSTTQREVQNRPEERTRNSERQKIAQNRPEVSAKKSVSGRKRFENEASRVEHSERCSTEKSKRLRREAKIGKIWVWHPVDLLSKLVDESCIESLLKEGWSRGMVPRSMNNRKTVSD